MANLVLSRSDLFPVGTSVGAYPGNAAPRSQLGPAAGPAIESATVASDGTATFTTLAPDTMYLFYAAVSGEHRRIRAAISSQDMGRAVGTGDTTNGAATVANAAVTSGSWRIGQRVSGAGIPPETYIRSISGSTLTLTQNATATATGVALEGHRGLAWRAKLMQRRNAIGTL